MKKITFSSDTGEFYRENMEITSKMARDYFETDLDPDQISPSTENRDWIFDNIIDCENIIRCDNEIIGFVLIIPSTKKILNDFISGKITEAVMFDRSKNIRIYEDVDALYLCSAFLKEGFRKKGIISSAAVKIIEKVSRKLKNKPALYFWAYSEEGKKTALKVAKITKLKILEKLD